MTYELMRQVEEQMEDELESAMRYIQLALNMKYSDRDFADAYFDMARQEVGHINVLHGLVTKSIKNMDGLSEEYVIMSKIYSFLRGQNAEKSEKVNTLLELFRK